MNPPITFPLCVVGDCPVGDRCLRRQALVTMDGTRRDTITAVNPVGLTPGADCPRFKPAEPVRMAAGFRGAMGAMPHANIGVVKSMIAQRFCLRNYYHLRNGERPMTPDEQEFVASVLERYGAPAPVRFDRYYDDYVWF